MGGYGILLIAALVIVSGVIAYVGDIIGRRMGRRRLSIFHLRPRYTAIVISVIAGMLIAAFTLISAMLVSQDVRDAFLHVDQMRRDNAQLQGESRRLEGEVVSAGRRNRLAQQQLSDADRQLHTISASLATKKHQLDSTRQRLSAAATFLARTRVELAKVNADLTKTQAQLAAKLQDLATAQAEAEKRGKLAIEAGRQYLQTQRELDDLTEERNRLLRDRERLQGELAAVQTETTDLTTQRDNLNADLTKLRDLYKQALKVVRSEPVVLGANEEILSTVIVGHRPESAVRADLTAFIDRVNQAAIAAGAGVGDNGRAIVYFAATPDESGQPMLFNEEQVLDGLASAIATYDSVVVSAVAVGNTVRGESVLVQFNLFRNVLVYRKGDEVARTTIVGAQEEAMTLLGLFTFLRSEVSARARAKGVMPSPAVHAAQAAPTPFGGPSEAVGEISYQDLQQALRDIQRLGGKARVIARAAEDAWTAGPLHLRLDIQPVR